MKISKLFNVNDNLKNIIENELVRFTKDLIIIDEESGSNKWRYYFQSDRLLFEYHYSHKILYCNVSEVIFYLKDLFSIDYFESEVIIKEFFSKFFDIEIEIFAVFSDAFSKEKVLEHLKK